MDKDAKGLTELDYKIIDAIVEILAPRLRKEFHDALLYGDATPPEIEGMEK